MKNKKYLVGDKWLEVRLIKVGPDVPPFGEETVHRYVLSLTLNDKTEVFDVWGSIAEYRAAFEERWNDLGKFTLTVDDAVEMILEDAQSHSLVEGLDDVEALRAINEEFDIDDPGHALIVLRSLRSTAAKLKRLGLREEEIEELLEEIRERE